MSYQYFNERERTGILVNFDLLSSLHLTDTGYAKMYPVKAPFGVSEMIGFNELLTCRDPQDKAVHFFLDDYQFERFWRTPERYIKALSVFPIVLAPDFSLYSNYPEPLQKWNHYRNQLLGAWMQYMGVCCVPTASWGGPETYSWCFDGVPEESDVAISTVGCLVQKDATQGLLDGLEYLLKTKKPTCLLVYGKVPPAMERLLKRYNTPWQQFAHGQAKRMGRER